MSSIGFCRSCNAKILWVETVNSKKTPIDIEAVDDGNVLIVGGQARVLSEVQRVEAKFKGAKLFKLHFATCKNAASHRKPKESK